MPKPAVDLLEGLAPAVAIEQRNPVVSSRSTVGTATEVYDYLRLLWARIGKPFCRVCGAPVRRDTPASVVDAVLSSQGLDRLDRLRRAIPGLLSGSAFGSRLACGAGRESPCARIRAHHRGRRGVAARASCRRDSTSPTRKEISWSWIVIDLATHDSRRSPTRLSRSPSRHGFRRGRRRSRSSCFDDGRLRFTEFLACSNCDTPVPADHPGALQLQQSPRRLRRLQRVRRGAGVRRVADRPRPAQIARRAAPSTRGPCRATKSGGSSWSRPRRSSAPTPTRRGPRSRPPSGASCCTASRAASPGSSPFSRAWRRSATSSTSASSSGATSSRRSARCVTAPGSTRARSSVRIGGPHHRGHRRAVGRRGPTLARWRWS